MEPIIEMAAHSSILTWRIPRTQEPGGLQSIRSQRVRHDWVTQHLLLFSRSVAQLCPILCHPMDCSTPGFPALHCLRELAQTHVHAQSKLPPLVALITQVVLLKKFLSELIILELENNLESRLFLLLSLIIFEDPDFPNSKHIEFHFLKFCFISVSIHFLLKYV